MQWTWHRSVLEKDIDAVMVRMGHYYVVMYPILFFAPMSNWKGGKDAFNEHGYAGKLGDMLSVHIY
jgi:hypothetical protein